MSKEALNYTYLISGISVGTLLIIASLLLILLIVMLRHNRKRRMGDKKKSYYGQVAGNAINMNQGSPATEDLSEMESVNNGFEIEFDITYIHTDEVIL